MTDRSHGSRFVRFGAATAGVTALSATATAHGGTEGGATPVAFGVVVGLPVAAGFLGGGVAVRRRRTHHRLGERQRSRLAIGFLLVVLGGTFALAAFAATNLPAAIAGGAVGAASAASIARRGRETERESPGHAHATLGAIGLHRLLEGIVLGTLYSTGAVVGLAGAITLAAHTALETAAVGGLYAPRRRGATGAIVLVQTSYAVGAGAGFAASGAVPAPVRVAVLALAGGVLLVTGVTETKRSFVSRRYHGSPVERAATDGEAGND